MSRRDTWQFRFFKDQGIRLNYQRIDRTTFGITIVTKRGSMYREANIREAFPSPFDMLNAFCLVGKEDTELNDVLTDEQFSALKYCKEINLDSKFAL